MSDEEEDDEALLPVARAIVDGASIPWSELHENNPGLDPSVILALEEVNRIASLRRTPRESRPFIPSRWGHLTVLDVHRDGEPRFIARDEGLGREVILTLIGPLEGDAARTEQLLQQSRRRTRIHHPNLATLYGADYSQDRVGYWMDSVKGQPLDELIDRQSVFSTADACRIVIDVCAAVEALHAEGLPHGSVSARQTVRAEDGRTILLSSVCLPGRATPAEPGPSPCTPEADLFDLGALLATLLLGNEGAPDRGLERLGQRLREKRTVPPPLIAIIEKSLDPDPRQRWRSASEFSEAIRTATAASRLSVEWVVGAAVVALLSGILLWLALAGR